MKRWLVKGSAVLAMAAGVALVVVESLQLAKGEVGAWFWIPVGVLAFAFGLAELILGKKDEDGADR